ncbi:unnamed protein product [Toxocara canis]|uniref:Secreted protein n=1 Tax=Toxocara canis TaxID=6265 RepID=A0A183UU32_TOXCA|nr:unnamed protein product [Toxocara canis]
MPRLAFCELLLFTPNRQCSCSNECGDAVNKIRGWKMSGAKFRAQPPRDHTSKLVEEENENADIDLLRNQIPPWGAIDLLRIQMRLRGTVELLLNPMPPCDIDLHRNQMLPCDTTCLFRNQMPPRS